MLNKARIVDVSGKHNNCGANVMLHALIDNWDKLGFESEALKTLLDLLRAQHPTLQSATPEAIKIAIDYIENEREKELKLGPVIRKHIANTLRADPEYRARWISELVAFDENKDPKVFASAAFQSYESLYAAIYPPEQINRMDESDLAVFKLEQAEEKPKLVKELQRCEGQIFNHYHNRLGRQSRARMISSEELCEYAFKMGCDLQIYRGDKKYWENTLFAQKKITPRFAFNAVNVNDIHWQYEAGAELSKKELARRQGAPQEYRESLRKKKTTGQKTTGQTFFGSVIDSVKNFFIAIKNAVVNFFKSIYGFVFSKSEEESISQSIGKNTSDKNKIEVIDGGKLTKLPAKNENYLPSQSGSASVPKKTSDQTVDSPARLPRNTRP